MKNEKLDIQIQCEEGRITWNHLIALISEKYSGYLVYRLNSVYSEIQLCLYDNKPKYVVGQVDGWWQCKQSKKEPAQSNHRLSLHWCRVDIRTFPAPWASLTKIENKG